MSMWDDEAGYDRDDPKHPDWAEAMADRADMDRKRAKESLPEPGQGDEVSPGREKVPQDARIGRPISPPSSGSESDLLRLKEAGFEVYGWVPMEADE